MLVIGNNEIEAGGIAPRTRKGKNLGCMPVADFADILQQDCRSALKNLA